MLTDKSSLGLQTRNKSTLLLELNSTATTPCNYKLFPQRLKKMHENGISRKARTIKILESLELLQFGKNQTTFQPSYKERNTNKNRISNYLTYKKQQRTLRQNHNLKLLNFKSKCIKSRCSSKISMQEPHTSQSNSPVKQISTSNSKLNLIVMGLNENQENQSNSPTKSRQFYIKTSEGRKQKVKTLDYENKIMSRLNESRRHDKQMMQQFNEYSQTSFAITTGPSLQNSKPQSCNTLRRRFNIKNKATSMACFNKEGSVEFRPWTSNKSDFGQ